jgi:hypothetical protein
MNIKTFVGAGFVAVIAWGYYVGATVAADCLLGALGK